jgi:hypothetical protein
MTLSGWKWGMHRETCEQGERKLEPGPSLLYLASLCGSETVVSTCLASGADPTAVEVRRLCATLTCFFSGLHARLCDRKVVVICCGVKRIIAVFPECFLDHWAG